MNKPTRKSSRIKSSNNVIPKESPVDSCPNSKGASKEPEASIVVSNKRRKTKEPSEGPLLNTSNSVDTNKSNNKRETVPPEEGSRRSTRRRDAESMGNKHKLLVDSCLNGTAIKRFDYETLVEMFDKRLKPHKNASCKSKQIITVQAGDKTFEMSKRDFYKVGIDESIIKLDAQESDEKHEKINGDIVSANENGEKSTKEIIEKDGEEDNFHKEEKEPMDELAACSNEVVKTEVDVNEKPVELEEVNPSTSNDIPLDISENISDNVPTTSVTVDESISSTQAVETSHPSLDSSSNILILPEQNITNLETDIDVDNQVSESQNETDVSKTERDNLSVPINNVTNSEVMDVDMPSSSNSPSTNDSGSSNEISNEVVTIKKVATDDNEKELTPMEVDETVKTITSEIVTPTKSLSTSNVSTPSKALSPNKLTPNTPTKMLSPQNLTSPSKLTTSPIKTQLASSPKVVSALTSNTEAIESPKAVEVSPQRDEHINEEVKSTVGPTEALKIIITDNTGSGTSTAPNSSVPSDTPIMAPSSNSNVEVIKSESSIYKRVKQLKEQGLWSQSRLPQVEEPKPQVIHWDLLLEEMAWMWSDFVRERKMKKQNRKHIGRAIKKLQSKMEGKEEEEERARRIRAEKMANRVAKEVKKFWEGAARLVDMKEQLILNKKRQEIRRKNMDKIVDQANIFSNQVGQTLQGGSVEPDDFIIDEDSNFTNPFNNVIKEEVDELDELDALVKGQNAPLSDILEGLPPQYLAEVQGMSSNLNCISNDASFDEIIPPKKRKVEELQEDELTLSSSGDQMDDDNSNMLVSPELSKSKITNFEKMREECETLQPQGFTLESAHINVEQPSMIRGVLREYQLLGLNWLYTLFKRHVNGILADEMGLGKTLQTISLLAYLVEKERIWRPHLIIVPTSVILNWDMEFKKWCPNFKTLVYHGTAKERSELRKGWTKDNSFDVVITSYKIVINDINVFRKRKWQYLILDEAHTIKNFKTQAWQKLVNLKSMNRLLLTGTPLQNDLMELHSLLKFLMPTIFTSQSDFKEVFNDPLVDFAGGNGDSNPELVGKLHDILRPFLLRRLKKDVEKQLPKKREIVVRCSLANRQRSLYDDFICRNETQVLLATGNIFHVLNVTMQLRKVCNHPNLHETRSVESPVVLFTIRVPYPAIVFDISQPIIDQKLRNLPTCMIFNGKRSYSIRALNCLRKIKCTRQEYASNLNSQTHVLPKLKGFKLNFHNFISTKIYNREDLKINQRLFDVDIKNLEMLNMKVGEQFVLSFDDDEIDRIPLVLKDKKPLLCKFEVDQVTKKLGMYVVNCNYVVLPSNLQELQFSRNTRNDFILIKKGEAEARKLRFHTIEHKNFSSVVQLPKNYPTKALLNFRAVFSQNNNKKTGQGGNNQSICKRESSQTDNDVDMVEANESDEKDFKTPEYFSYLRNLNPEDFVDRQAREQKLLEKENCADMISALSVERINNMRDPLIYDETVSLLKREFKENLELTDHSVTFNWLDYETSAEMYNKRFLENLLDNCIDKFDIFTYPAISRGIQPIPVGKGRNYDIINEMDSIEKLSKKLYDSLDIYYHKLQTSAMFSFPELRLIEYDCGKLQRLTVMLRELFHQGHRVLIFTQMSSMLDILQEFLSYHGYKYFRLDGSTPLDQRQAMMEQFNNDDKIFCFILSTRSGGIGINLTGADTVIFYDSDWNPTMDAQAQDRCHRIGQTKDVTIYRLISEYTIEEAILERATMKRKLGEMAIDNAKFTPDYFKNMTIKDLFKDNINSLDKNIIESKVEVASDNEIRKALALTEDKVDANAAELAEKEAATEYDEILPNPQSYDDQEIDEELKPLVDSLTDVEKYAVKYLQQLNDPELQKRLEEIEMNDQLVDIENLNERKESTDGFDEVSSKKNRKRINPNNVLPSRASERISRVALNKIIEAEDKEAFAKVKQMCKIKDKSSKKSSINSNISHSKDRCKKSDNISKRSNKKEGKNSIKKKRNIKNNTSNIDVVVKEDSSSNNSKSSKTSNNSNVISSPPTTKSLVSPPILPPKISSSRLIKQPCTNNVSFTPKPIVKSSTLVNNFASQNLPIRSNSPKMDYIQSGGRIFCAKLSKNVSTVIKPPRKCYNTLPISKPPIRQPIFRNTPVSLNSNISQSSNINNKPPEVKRVVYICVKNNSQNATNQILLIPHTYFDVPTYAPLSPPLTQYDYEALYYDPSQYCLYRSDLMTEAELPSHIYEWPKRKQNNKLGLINVDTNQTNTINDYLRSNERYSPSASALISMESSPKDCTDTAAPSPIPMESEERIRRTIIGGESYNCPRIPPICCDPILFGETRQVMDYNLFNRLSTFYSERGGPYNCRYDYEQLNWNVVEDYFLFKSVVLDQNIRSADFNTSHFREMPNWLYVESVVNKYSKVYRPARQCHLRYLHSIIPKEEGKDQVYDVIGKKIRKVQISPAEHSFRKRHGKKRLEEFYLHDAKKILKLSIAAEAKVIVSQPLKKNKFSLVPEVDIDYTDFSDAMKESMIERLNFKAENKFSVKNFSDPNYKLKNWMKNDYPPLSKPSHIDHTVESMTKRVKDYHDRTIPFKKTALCVGNNNSFLDPVDCTTIERVDFSDSNIFRQQAPVVRSDYSSIGPTRTIQIARRPVNISGSQINVGQTPQLMSMAYRSSGGLTINNNGQGNTTRYIQTGDINHQRRFSVQSNRTSTLSQSSSTSSGTTTIQQYHSQGPQKQQQPQSLMNPPQSQQQSSSQQQYHSSVVVNSGDRGIPRIASFQYVQSKNHPTPQNVTRPPVRTMYPAGTGRKIHQMPTSRIQGSGNYIYGVQSGHPNIVKTVSTHRIITKPSPSSQQQPQQQQQQQQSQPPPHQQQPQRLPQNAGPSYILKEKLSL